MFVVAKMLAFTISRPCWFPLGQATRELVMTAILSFDTDDRQCWAGRGKTHMV